MIEDGDRHTKVQILFPQAQGKYACSYPLPEVRTQQSDRHASGEQIGALIRHSENSTMAHRTANKRNSSRFEKPDVAYGKPISFTARIGCQLRDLYPLPPPSPAAKKQEEDRDCDPFAILIQQLADKLGEGAN